MEDTLRVLQVVMILTPSIVLILIIMEDTLRAKEDFFNNFEIERS